jgi:Protein of unknown function DUF45
VASPKGTFRTPEQRGAGIDGNGAAWDHNGRMTESSSPWQLPLFGGPGRPEPSAPAPPADAVLRPAVEIRTSSRRRKTATAFWEADRIVVVLPAHLRGAKRQEMVDWLVARVEARRPQARGTDAELAERAATLADRYVDGVRATSVRWVTNQSKRWGSCSGATGEIRLSDRLRRVPGWVLDAVLVHELAHLVHADHSAQFHRLVERFPKGKEAAAFLEGYALGLEAATS